MRAKIKSVLVVLALAMLGFASLHILWADDCSQLLDEQRIKSEQILGANAFTINRGYWDYRRHLGSAFSSKLKSMGEDGHWLDAGAGLAKSQRGYFSQIWFRNRKKPRMTAFSVAKPESKALNEFEARVSSDRFQYLSGESIVTFDSEAIAPTDLISDDIGAASYVEDLSGLIKFYGGKSKLGGEIQINLYLDDNSSVLAQMYSHGSSGEGKTVKVLTLQDSGGNELDWIDSWFSKFQGLKLVSGGKYSSFLGGQSLRIILRKTSKTVIVPDLKLITFKAGRPPERVFSLSYSAKSATHR